MIQILEGLASNIDGMQHRSRLGPRDSPAEHDERQVAVAIRR